MRWKLYLRQTYTTPGIYIKTLLFATHDQVIDSNPEWGDDFQGFVKRLGNRQVQFIIQNSVSSLGNGIAGWEPRYDRCRCDGFWPRTRHAVVRNFVTYDLPLERGGGDRACWLTSYKKDCHRKLAGPNLRLSESVARSLAVGIQPVCWARFQSQR
jgi:hypothetical protein